MIDKQVETIASALDGLNDGATLLLGGFGSVGQAVQLIEGILALDARELVVVANNAGYGNVGLARILKEKRVRKIICSYPRISGSTVFEDLYAAGQIELELVPQGTLAERMRAAGAGIPAFYTPTGAGTDIAKGKEQRDINGRLCVLEEALFGDFALIEAWQADRLGNLSFRAAGRNFNPICAMAATTTICQTQHMVAVGDLDPETIVTPGIYVDRVLHLPYGNPVS